MGIADMENPHNVRRYLVGRHTVVFQAGTVINVNLRSDLPVVREVGSQFVFISFGIFPDLAH